MDSTTILTCPAAAELAGLGIHAIYRALREGRLKYAAVLVLGDRSTRLIDLNSLVLTYDLLPLSAQNRAKLETWKQWAPTITAATGRAFLLLDSSAPFLHMNKE